MAQKQQKRVKRKTTGDSELHGKYQSDPFMAPPPSGPGLNYPHEMEAVRRIAEGRAAAKKKSAGR